MYPLDASWLNKEAQRYAEKYFWRKESPIILVDSLSDEEWRSEVERDNADGVITYAVYRSKTKTIEFNSTRNKHRTLSQLRGTIRHELAHWSLHISDYPYGDSDVRFAVELLRVRAANTCNPDEKAQQAMREAKKLVKKAKQLRVFELRDRWYDFEIKLRHPQKTTEDFHKDTKEAYLRFHKDNMEQFDDWFGFSLEELATMMKEWYGYEIVGENIIASISLVSHYDGNIGDEESLEDNLLTLGVDDNEAELIVEQTKEKVR